MLATSLGYFVCGVFAAILFLLPAARRGMRIDWLHAAPFAASWFIAMILLYACFAELNVVFGNVIQSTRGLISVVIGAHIAGLGMVHLEQAQGRKVLFRKLLAAVMMSAAISLFVLSRPAEGPASQDRRSHSDTGSSGPHSLVR